MGTGHILRSYMEEDAMLSSHRWGQGNEEVTKKTFPRSAYRLCSCHLLKNAKSNVRSNQFSNGFEWCMVINNNTDEFEERWYAMIQKL